MVSSQHYPSANMPARQLHKENQTGNYAFWLTYEKSIHLLQMITSTTTTQSAHYQMQHSIWQEKICFANLIVPKHIIASKWPTNNPLNSLHSTLQVEHSRTEDWHKDSAVPYQHSRASYVNTSIQSSKLINAHNTSMTLA